MTSPIQIARGRFATTEAIRPHTLLRPMFAEAGRAFGWKGQNTARPMVMSAAGRNVSAARIAMAMPIAATGPRRSEEHTSELQSRFDLVCRLLLEKKKKSRDEYDE